MYARADDLIQRYPLRELIERTAPNADAPDSMRLDAAIAQACALIDRHLTRYNLPLSDYPTSLTDAACALARWHLYDYEPPEPIQRLFDDTLSWLRRLESGAASLHMSAPTQGVERKIVMRTTRRGVWC